MNDRTERARIARGVGSLLALVLLVVGVPAALWIYVGWPLPRALPGWDGVRSALTSAGVPDDVLIKGLALVCWIAWLVLLASVLAEVAGVVRGRGARRIPLARPFQALAATLVAAVAMTLTLLTPRPAPARAQPLALALSQTSVDEAAAFGVTEQSPAPYQRVRFQAAAGTAASSIYTVRPRDTLWAIAEGHLGDPFRWPEAFRLNQGRPQPDGRSLNDPSLIRPGWLLELPAGGTAPPLPDGARPPSGDTTGTAHATVPPLTTAPTSSTLAMTTTVPSSHREAGPDGEIRRPQPGLGVQLPSGSVVGLSLAAGISACLAAARLHRRRRHVPAAPTVGIESEEPFATDAVRRLRRATLQSDASRRASPGRPDCDSSPKHQPRVGTVSAGAKDGEAITLDLVGTGGVALSGAGAPGVARAAIVDLLSNSPAHTVEVIVAGDAVADDLFPGVVPFAGLDIVADTATATSRLEVELIRRTRLLEDDDEGDFASFVGEHPEEALPALILVVDGNRNAAKLRLEAVLSVGRRLGIGALVVGTWPTAATIEVGDDLSAGVSEPNGAFGHLAGGRLFALEPAEAAELMAVVAASRGGLVAPEGPVLFDVEQFPAPSRSKGPIVVHLLGAYRIEVGGDEIRTGLRTKARELLALLLLHPDGRSTEAAVDAVWPDVDPARGVEGFRTAVGNLRKVLRSAIGDPAAEVIERLGERYRVEAALFECDVWRVEAALADSRVASDAGAALERVAAESSGDLLDGSFYQWAETPREDIRRRLVDALAKLAELHERDGEDDRAVVVLQSALRLDPYNEELHRRLMEVEARQGRTDAARRTFRQLESRLAELDVDPDERTLELVDRLLNRERVPGAARR